MFRLLCLLSLTALSAYADSSIVSGRVADENNHPLPEARVFVEPGLGGALVEAAADAEGRFRVEGSFQGGVGVFAMAPGRGFGGKHLNLALGESVDNLVITLPEEGRVAGKVVNAKGEPVKGALLTRIALTSPDKVGIPLSKLEAKGIKAPASDDSGAFILTGLPKNGRVAIKAGHPEYAQEAVDEVVVGTSNVKITLDRGVLISGEVHTRQTQTPVSGVTVVIRNAQPPHDTALARTDAFGAFSLRLKPGVYMSQATAVNQATPGWQQFSVTGENPELKVNLGLAGMGTVKGAINDAVSGKAVEGVRIRLESAGNVAAILRTGPDGVFSTTAAEGDNILYFETTPGFLPPEPRALRVAVTAGSTVELPGMWLAPLPAYRLQAFDEDETTPIAGAAITLLRPRQFGWIMTGPDGWAELRIANLPEDGRIIGYIQHPTTAKAALFALNRGDSKGAAVKLMPCATVTGSVVTEKGKAATHTMVGAAYPESADDAPLLLWRTLTDENGRFQWTGVLAGVPQRCAAVIGAAAQGESVDFNLAPQETRELPPITLTGAPAVGSRDDFLEDWRKYRRIGGDEPPPGTPLMILCCEASVADPMMEAVAQAVKLAGHPTLSAVVVVSGAYTVHTEGIAVYASPETVKPTTYLVNSAGQVVLSTFGLPPLYALKGLQ